MFSTTAALAIWHLFALATLSAGVFVAMRNVAKIRRTIARLSASGRWASPNGYQAIPSNREIGERPTVPALVTDLREPLLVESQAREIEGLKAQLETMARNLRGVYESSEALKGQLASARAQLSSARQDLVKARTERATATPEPVNVGALVFKAAKVDGLAVAVKRAKLAAVREALAECDGNQSAGAKLVGIPRATFAKAVKELKVASILAGQGAQV